MNENIRNSTVRMEKSILYILWSLLFIFPAAKILSFFEKIVEVSYSEFVSMMVCSFLNCQSKYEKL